MTKISQYPTISNPSIDDLLIGTDENNSLITKNFKISDVIALGNGVQGPIGPQGDTGPTGPQGPVGPAGLTWQGSWDPDNEYFVNDAVGYDGASYFCISYIEPNQDSPNPTVDTDHWALLASQGAIGPTGPAGPTGPQGPAGTAILNYKAYRASLVFGSGEITVTVHENNLGDNITWAYNMGYVTCTSSSLLPIFTSDKTFATSTTYYGSGVVCSFNPFINSEFSISYLSKKTSDNSTFIPYSAAVINVEILVYN